MLLACAWLVPHAEADYIGDENDVLVLFGHEPGNRYREEPLAGFARVWAEQPNRPTLHLRTVSPALRDAPEYLDAYMQALAAEHKLWDYQCVVLMGERATEAFLAYRERHFEGVPAVFCMIGEVGLEIAQGEENITGIVDIMAIEETLRVATELFPKATTILATRDLSTRDGRLKARQLEGTVQSLNRRLEVIYLDSTEEEALTAAVAALPKDTFAVAVGQVRNAQGEADGPWTVSRKILRLRALPIFSFWPGPGPTLGGKVHDESLKGAAAAELVMRILQGEDPDRIPVERRDSSRFHFDYAKLVAAGANLEAIPASAQIVNPPPPNRTWSRLVSWKTATGTVLLAALALSVLSWARLRKALRRIHAQLAESRQRMAALHAMSLPARTIDVETERVFAQTTDPSILACLRTVLTASRAGRAILRGFIEGSDQDRLDLVEELEYLGRLLQTAGADETRTVVVRFRENTARRYHGNLSNFRSLLIQMAALTEPKHPVDGAVIELDAWARTGPDDDRKLVVVQISFRSEENATDRHLPGPRTICRRDALAAARSHAEQMGGALEWSHGGRAGYRCVTLYLPLEIEKSPSMKREAPPLAGRRTLVISPIEAVADHLVESVRLAGGTAVGFPRIEALPAIEDSSEPDLIAIDELALGNTPRRGLANLEEHFLGGKLPPMILIASHRRSVAAQAAESIARVAIVEKPVTLRALHQAVTQLDKTPEDPGPSERATRRQAPAPIAETTAAKPKAPVSGLVALVVDDNAVNLRVAKLILEKLGCQVVAVDDGAMGVACAREKSIDFILLDCEMPGMDGYEAARQIRENERSDRHLPIFALTAHSSEEQAQKCLAAGMDRTLTKPIRAETLRPLLEEFFLSANGQE